MVGFHYIQMISFFKKNTNRFKIQHYGFEYGRRETICDFIY